MYSNRDNLLPPWVNVILRANKQSQSWPMMATGQGYTGHYLHLFEDTNSISLNMRLFRTLYGLFSTVCHMLFKTLILLVDCVSQLKEKKKDRNSRMKGFMPFI